MHQCPLLEERDQLFDNEARMRAFCCTAMLSLSIWFKLHFYEISGRLLQTVLTTTHRLFIWFEVLESIASLWIIN